MFLIVTLYITLGLLVVLLTTQNSGAYYKKMKIAYRLYAVRNNKDPMMCDEPEWFISQVIVVIALWPLVLVNVLTDQSKR